MKNFKLFLLIGVGLLFLASCNSTKFTGKWEAPAFTSVDKLIKVQQGMSIDEVNKTLGIEPYNIYNMQEDGSTVLLYNYRTKLRNVAVPKDIFKREAYIRGDEASQTAGTTWYNTEWYVAYVFFDNGKVKSILTDQGRADAEYLHLVQNNIQTISKNKVTNYKLEILNKDQHPENIIFPLSNNLRKVDSGTSQFSTIVNTKSKKKQK